MRSNGCSYLVDFNDFDHGIDDSFRSRNREALEATAEDGEGAFEYIFRSLASGRRCTFKRICSSRALKH